MSRPIIGAQLYTLRETLKTPDAIATTLKQVADIGYTSVQVSGIGEIEPSELVKMTDGNGLTIGATHMGWTQFQNELDHVIETHKTWKCSHAAIGGLPGEYSSMDGIKRFIEELAPIAERLAAEGMDFSYHNHSHELVKYDGTTWLERLYTQAPPEMLKAEIDTYWIQHGGGDPAQWLRDCAGREPVIHIKDMIITPEREQRFSEIGEGNLNWPAILAAAELGGVEFMMVEEDNCFDLAPIDALAISYRNLVAMGYA
ncbi:MAG: sugar phosphate isomerase/epimerase [Lentisphaerae bacterium]|nr:sugar phosphate isomerase/epimerase [Lentisphaerota bacterium]